MKTLNTTLWLSALLSASACGLGPGTDDDETGLETGEETDDTDETDDTTPVDVTPEWNEDAWANGPSDFVDCSGGSVTFSAETKNWGFDVALYMSMTRFYGEYAAWEENHTLDEESASANNDGEGYSVFERTLSTDAALDDQTGDVSTLFGCADLDPSNTENAQVSYALAVWGEDDDSSSDDPADCIVFGQDPQELLDNGYTGGTGDGADRTLPSWFNATNCRIVD